MGLASHLLAATLRLSAAQRLVRRLCPVCREAYALAADEAAVLGRKDLAGKTVWRAHGCLACAGRGYAGRTGVFELVTPDTAFASRIAAGAHEDELRSMLAESGAATLSQNAIAKLLAGETDIGELLRAFDL
jgi:type II secretory ATPase GspE/PulE/Tfp pilus assembly ATPase PilB-like protein